MGVPLGLEDCTPCRQAELDVIREKLPRNNKGAEGIGTSYVTCRTQCKNKNVGSLFKSDDKSRR